MLKNNKASLNKRGKKNPMWKGDKAKMSSLHEWVGNRLNKPKLCQFCKKTKPLDLCNISGKYKRDLTDWEWLCRSCHMIKDGRMEKLHKKMGHFKKCLMCGQQVWLKPSDVIRRKKYCSRSCYFDCRYNRV